MEFIEAMKAFGRMCEANHCENCLFRKEDNIFCRDLILSNPEKAEKILSKWAEEHPVKTILMDFLEKYPNAQMYEDGTPKGPCPYHLGYDDSDECIYDDVYICCKKCWNRPLED